MNLTVAGHYFSFNTLLYASYGNTAKVSVAFEAPQGQEPFDYIFDLTGEVRPERLEEVRFAVTASISAFSLILSDSNRTDVLRSKAMRIGSCEAES